MHLTDPAASPDMALNQVAIHEPALAVVAQLLSTAMPDLRLAQCALRSRYGPASADAAATADEDTGDQAFHVDFGNNSLVVPKRSSPDAVAALLYCSDVEEAGAPTHAAPAHPGELTTYGVEAPFIPPSSLTHLNSPELMDRLYKEERPVRYRLGTILLYRLDAFKLIDLC